MNNKITTAREDEAEVTGFISASYPSGLKLLAPFEGRSVSVANGFAPEVSNINLEQLLRLQLA
jgi:hypothetical protein